MLLSIIVPCYNVEGYVVECLDSIFAQIDDAAELILVEDGSTDKTWNVISAYLDSHQCPASIRIIRQRNQGLSGARNTGLAASRGDYIAFLDSDDVWTDGAWQQLRPLLASGQYDLLEFDAFRFHGDARLAAANRNASLGLNCGDGEFDGCDITSLKKVFAKNYWLAWARVYRKTLIADHAFEVGRRFEDKMFTPYAYLRADNLYSSPFKLVGYRVNPDSITHNLRSSDVSDIVYGINKMVSYATVHAAALGQRAQLLYLSAALECGSFLSKKILLGHRSVSPAERAALHSVRGEVRYRDLSAGIGKVTFIFLGMHVPRAVLCLYPFLRHFKRALGY